MPSAATATMAKMLETLPEQLQDRVLDHLRDYIEDLREDANWSASFAKSQGKLISAARQARQEIAKGQSVPLDIERL